MYYSNIKNNLSFQYVEIENYYKLTSSIKINYGGNFIINDVDKINIDNRIINGIRCDYEFLTKKGSSEILINSYYKKLSYGTSEYKKIINIFNIYKNFNSGICNVNISGDVYVIILPSILFMSHIKSDSVIIKTANYNLRCSDSNIIYNGSIVIGYMIPQIGMFIFMNSDIINDIENNGVDKVYISYKYYRFMANRELSLIVDKDQLDVSRNSADYNNFKYKAYVFDDVKNELINNKKVYITGLRLYDNMMNLVGVVKLNNAIPKKDDAYTIRINTVE